jgi:TonB family protein
VSARSPYFVSSLGHALFLGTLLTLAAVHRPPSIVPGVKIVALAGRSRVAPAPPAPAARVEPAPAEKPSPPAPVVEPKEKPQDTAPPERRPERQDPKGTKPPAPREIVSKAPSKPKPPAGSTAPAASAVAPSAAVAAGSAIDVGIEGGEGEPGIVSSYLALLRDKVAAAWQPPASIGRTGEARVTVSFSIERAGGQPVDLVVQAPSGASVYDLAAQRAVYNAAPLPPLPSAWPHDSIGIRFTFQQSY